MPGERALRDVGQVVRITGHHHVCYRQGFISGGAMNSDLMRRVAFTLGALLVYRLGTFIPLPGIDPAVWEQIFRGQSGGLLWMLSLFSGGAVSRLSIFALNLIPYLTAAILVQVALLFSSRLGALVRPRRSLPTDPPACEARGCLVP